MVRSLMVLLAFMLSHRLFAADAYLFRFNTQGRLINNCQTMVWHDQALLYNRGGAPAIVRVLEISNGVPARTNDAEIERAGPRRRSALSVHPGGTQGTPQRGREFEAHLNVAGGMLMDPWAAARYWQEKQEEY